MTGRKWSDIAQYPKLPLCGHRDVNSQWAYCLSHCCRIRTADIRTAVAFALSAFALLTFSHCWHSHCWLRTGVVRTVVFRSLVGIPFRTVRLHFSNQFSISSPVIVRNRRIEPKIGLLNLSNKKEKEREKASWSTLFVQVCDWLRALFNFGSNTTTQRSSRRGRFRAQKKKKKKKTKCKAQKYKRTLTGSSSKGLPRQCI